MNQSTHPPVLEALKGLDGLSTEESLRQDALHRETTFADERDALDFAWHDGNEQGIAQGQSSLLAKQIIQKFGSLPDNQLRTLEQASPQQREAWAVRLLDAHQLEDVFRD